MLFTGRGVLLGRRGIADEADVVVPHTFSSTMVFHSPHAGHLPVHFGESAPQEVQNHIVLVFVLAMARI